MAVASQLCAHIIDHTADVVYEYWVVINRNSLATLH